MTSDRLATAFRGALTGALFALRVDTTPSPACRPRVTMHGTFYAPTYKVFQKELLEAMVREAPKVPLLGDLGVYVEVVVQKPKKTILARPRGDIDNYVKGPLDAATKAKVWGDDDQVVTILGTKRWTEPGEAPGIHITAGGLPR